MQGQPNHYGDQADRESVAHNGQQQTAGRIADGFFQAQLYAALDQDQHQRQHSQDPDHVLKMAGIDPLQYGSQADADQQQDDDVGNTRPTRKTVRGYRDNEQRGGKPEDACHVHVSQTNLGKELGNFALFLDKMPAHLRDTGCPILPLLLGKGGVLKPSNLKLETRNLKLGYCYSVFTNPTAGTSSFPFFWERVGRFPLFRLHKPDCNLARRGPSSSTSMTRCHVPRIAEPFPTRSVTDVPIMADKM